MKFMRKENLIKNIYKIIFVVLCIILIKLFITFCLNEYFISQYKQNDYSASLVEKLFILNMYQPYIAHYNYGNVLYNQGKYDEAIEEYQKALKLYPPKNKECLIRINLALSMIKKLHNEPQNDDEIKEDLNILEDAKDILCEKGCANENNNKGHNRQAQRLKNDIDDRIEELKQMQEQPNEEEEEDEEKEQPEEENKEEVKKQLEEIKKQSMEERQEVIDTMRILYEDGGFYDGKTW